MRTWSGVPAAKIDAVWPQISFWVSRACEKSGGKYWPEDVKKALQERGFQLWAAFKEDCIDAAAITEIVSYPRKKCARVLIGMGSNPADIDGFLELFTEWARAHGCDLSGEIRPAFAEQYRKAGWRKTHYIMERKL